MEDTKHKLSVVKFQGCTVPIFWAKSNKCSALVALINFLNVKNGVNADATCLPDTASQNFLTSQIEKCIKKFFSDTTDPLLENFMYLAKSLHRQVSLNPINAECSMFEKTVEYNLFTLLGVTVLHGWVLDPEDQNFKSLAEMPYNSMAALSTLKTSSSKHICDNALAAENFMNASNRQLTSFGLQQLTDTVMERGIAVLYRDNEFNLLYKHDGDLFTLEVCEDKLTQLPTGVWKKLAVEEEKSFYVADDLSPTMGQHEEKYRLADEWFKAKISAFDDDKKPSQKKKKKKSKRNLKIGIAEDSGVKSILHSSDVDQSEGSSTSEAAGLASQESSEEPSGLTSEAAGLASQESSEEPSGSTSKAAGLASQESSEEPSASLKVVPTPTAQKFFNFLTQFQDESGALYFESAVKEMIHTSFRKLYVPFSILQNHDGNLAIEIQDGTPGFTMS